MRGCKLPKLLMVGAFLALLCIAPTATAQITDNVYLNCPIEFNPPAQDTVIDIVISADNVDSLGGFSLGFHYNSDLVEIDSVNAWGSIVPGPIPGIPPILKITYLPDDNIILVGWADFSFENPIPPQEGGYWFTMKMHIPAGIDPTCIDIDSVFVPPAGQFIFAPKAGGQVTPNYIDCGTGDINIGDACGEPVTPPVAVCTDATVDANGSCQAEASVDDGSYDPEGQDITIVQEPPGPYPLGETSVMLIVTDTDMAADTCEALVTVVDVTPPVVTCPANIIRGNDPGQCGATVTFSATATDNCSVQSITYNPTSGSFFDVGLTQVRVIAVDGADLADTCFFNVTVLDNTAPVVTCPANIEVDNDPGECGAIVEFSATATDNCSVESITYNPTSGSMFDIGTTQVRVIALDPAGKADTCTFDVTVTDTEGPIANCPGDIEVNNDPGQDGAIVNFTSTASDNCPGATVVCTPASGSFFPIGETTVECIATDVTDFRDTCEFLVTVNYANNPPVARDTSVITPEDTPVGCQMQAYDTDSDPLTFNVVDGPFNGAMTDFDSNTGGFTYTPNAGYVGPDTVFFTAFDGTDPSNTAKVSILVSGGGKAVIIPEPQYIYYSFRVMPEWEDTVYLGNLPEGYTVGDIDETTLMINGSLMPTSATILPSYPDFSGEVMELVFPLPQFLNPYGALYDTTYHTYSVSGHFDDTEPFIVIGDVTIIGKYSHDPGKFITPPDVLVLRGDIDKNGRINVADATELIAFIFGEAEPPLPRSCADVDCSISVNIADAVYLVAYIFGEEDAPCPVQ